MSKPRFYIGQSALTGSTLIHDRRPRWTISEKCALFNGRLTIAQKVCRELADAGPEYCLGDAIAWMEERQDKYKRLYGHRQITLRRRRDEAIWAAIEEKYYS